jgi:hypothetical protein
MFSGDTRGALRFNALKKEKRVRKLRNGGFHDSDNEGSNSHVCHLQVGRRDRVYNPGNFQLRSRTESPPRKSKRSKKGFNSGSFCGCPFCRPKIATRIASTAENRRTARLGKEASEFSIKI